jgi:hypothetical protein
MNIMLDRGDHDEFLADCPWTKEDAQYCDAHDIELSYSEDEEGREVRYCRECEGAELELP